MSLSVHNDVTLASKSAIRNIIIVFIKALNTGTKTALDLCIIIIIFYVHRHTLCYLPGSAVPQPKAASAVRKALVKWEAGGGQPEKVLRLGEVRNIVGDPQSNELELTLANGQKRSYKATSEHELLLWKRTFEKYARFSTIAGL